MSKALMIDYEFCTGCHACEVACRKYLELDSGQFGIKILQDGPRELENGRWEYNFLPMPTSLCDLCATRIEQGKDATCVHHCPAHALKFGEVQDIAKMIAEKGNRCMFVPTV